MHRAVMTSNLRSAWPVHREVVLVTVEAGLLQEGKPIVYKLGGGGPQPVAVTLGLSDLFYVELTAGLAPGDSIALEDPVAAGGRARDPARRGCCGAWSRRARTRRRIALVRGAARGRAGGGG